MKYKAAQHRERTSRAFAHDQAMVKKYLPIRGVEANNYDWWFETDGQPEPYATITHRDYPLPYSWRYFRRFLGSVFNSYPSDALDFLSTEFPSLDATDAEYIEPLLIQVEENGLLENNVVFRACGYGSYGFDRRDNDSSDSIFFGSELNRKRVDLVRRWLADNAKAGSIANEAMSNGQVVPRDANGPENDPKMKSRQRRVALLYVYSNRDIPKNNEIAQQYGWSSAESLYNQYRGVLRPGDRINATDKQRMITDIKAVIPHLSDAYREQALSELAKLEKKDSDR